MRREWLLSEKFRWIGYVHTLEQSRDEKEKKEEKKSSKREDWAFDWIGKVGKVKFNNIEGAASLLHYIRLYISTHKHTSNK